jgi:hypothetical protein
MTSRNRGAYLSLCVVQDAHDVLLDFPQPYPPVHSQKTTHCGSPHVSDPLT